MAKVAITESYLEDMADALREKTGLSTATFKPSEMANAISSISGGGITPTGTINITENGTHDVTTYASAYVSVSGGGGSPTISSLSVTPSASQQVFNSSSVDGYKPVTVNAAPSATLNSIIVLENEPISVSVNDTGYVAASLVDLDNIYGPIASQAGWVTTTDEVHIILQEYGGYQLPTKAAATITPGTSNQTIASGTYLTGAQTISGDANLVAGNIKSGVSIFGVLGTYTGGGGGSSNFVLLGTQSVGTVSTSSTSAADTGVTITVKGVYDYDLLVCECSVDTKTNNRHAATTRLLWLTASSNVSTKDGGTFATATHNIKLSSTGVATTRSNTTAYGVYANSVTVSAGSTGDNGQAVITIYRRYNSTYTGTINGSYTMRVYGVKIYDLIGG